MSVLNHLHWGAVLAVIFTMGLTGCTERDSATQGTGAVGAKSAVTERDSDELNIQESSSAGPMAYIVSPKDGARVRSTFKVIFGLSGMGVAPAGIKKDSTGHHHLLIDVAQLPPMDRMLPSTDNIVHFGNGQTETMVTLPPGTHTLQLLLGDFMHVPHATPVLSEVVTVTVIE